ncbi:glycosyltransferase family 4 protein [Pontibacter pudoricolor]|uniref:glycosyltransferase family 4 protein n=1 Tax=Pontibacter pudoricolor TaxID=2694930 RepID=UPI0013911AE1|nr:glycosyltransferase family 4 protein [Pontibacter pudoricolor]
MNILINLIPIKKGGGQQVATNFIEHISQASDMGFNIYVCCTENTEIHRLLVNADIEKVFAVNNSLLSRAVFSYKEYYTIIYKHSIDVVYTMFGPSLPKAKEVLTVVGCAYSNIFYPEVNFWEKWPLKKRLIAKAIDYYRLKTTLNADAVIFENESMRLRSKNIYDFPSERSIFIKPSVSSHLLKANSLTIKSSERNNIHSTKQILLLTGWHLNKNLQALPNIAYALNLKGVNDVIFTVTISKEHEGALSLIQEAKRLGVENYLNFIGTVSPFELEELYKNSYAVMLLSLLESFSNNIIESWAMKRPLIISDLEWARSICNKAAYYVDRDSSDQVAAAIKNLVDDSLLYNNLVNEGVKELSTYPSPSEKVKLQFEFIKRLHEKGV